MKKILLSTIALVSILSYPSSCPAASSVADQPEVEGDINYAVGDEVFFFTRYDITSDYEGNPALVLSFEYTNNSADPNMAASDFYIQVFQNGIEKDVCFLSSDSQWADLEHNLTTDIKDGVSLSVCRSFALDDLSSPIEIESSEFVNFSDSQKMTIDISQYAGSVPETEAETESALSAQSEEYDILKSEYETLKSDYESLQSEYSKLQSENGSLLAQINSETESETASEAETELETETESKAETKSETTSLATYSDDYISFEYATDSYCEISYYTSGDNMMYSCDTSMTDEDYSSNVNASIGIENIEDYESTFELSRVLGKNPFFPMIKMAKS